MSDLHIPDAAEDLWFECGCQDEKCDREGYQKVALPYIVAAELRRLADWHWEPDQVTQDICGHLRARADELDGGAS